MVCGQGAFFAAYTLFYVLTPRIAHRFVGYLEEEAVHTYSEMLKMVDEGNLSLLFGVESLTFYTMGKYVFSFFHRLLVLDLKIEYVERKKSTQKLAPHLFFFSWATESFFDRC